MVSVETGVQPSELLDGPAWLIPALTAYLRDKAETIKRSR